MSYIKYVYLFCVCTVGMVKVKLPEEFTYIFPLDILRIIDSYLPHIKKEPSPKTSPSLERELRKIQSKSYRGKSPMYMRDLDDFILDRCDD